MMNRYFLSFVCLFFAGLLAFTAYGQVGEPEANIDPVSFKTTSIEIVTQDKTHWMRVDLATTPAQWQRGLMYRKVMPLDTGMLFIFPNEKLQYFWMKNTFIPLDILFLDAQGQILHIHHNAEPLSEARISSKYPARMVLEINAGLSERLELSVGDKIKLSEYLRIKG